MEDISIKGIVLRGNKPPSLVPSVGLAISISPKRFTISLERKQCVIRAIPRVFPPEIMAEVDILRGKQALFGPFIFCFHLQSFLFKKFITSLFLIFIHF